MNHYILKTLFPLLSLFTLSSLSFPSFPSSPSSSSSSSSPPSPASPSPPASLSSSWLPPTAHAYFPVSCKVAGTAKIDASGMGMTYNHRFDLSYGLRFHMEDPSQVTVDITHEGHTSTMKGTLVNDSLIRLSAGQHIPQNFDGEGFSAALTGVVKKGFLTCTHSGNVRLFADLDASGQLLVMTFPIPVKGTIETDARN